MTTQFNVRGTVPAVYNGYNLTKEFFDSVGKVDHVCIHAWPSDKTKAAFKDLRVRNPDVGITLGVGVDSMARSAVLTNSPTAAIREFERVVRVAMEYAGGIQAVMWNAEASWKRPPTSVEARRLSVVVKETLESIASRYPTLPQLHTAYDHPTYHSTYNWRDWLGGSSPICASFPQVYAAPGDGLMAHRGSLAKREAAALSSWKAAVKKGWIKADAPEGTPEDLHDVDWYPYYQLHSVPVADTLRHMMKAPLSFGWALPGRADKDGEAALKCALILRRRGYHGPAAVLDWQNDHGLVEDNIAGWGQTIPSILAAV